MGMAQVDVSRREKDCRDYISKEGRVYRPGRTIAVNQSSVASVTNPLNALKSLSLSWF